MNAAVESGLEGMMGSTTRFLFFTGKGGVGKTSLACAWAIALADSGLRVLLVSTDPASNLDELLGVRLGTMPTKIPGIPRLEALNIDPAAAAAAYREKLVGPYRDKLPDPILRAMEEQFSGACTMEMAAFDEFSRLLGHPEATSDFDHVLFDTAPTGHTLRLLSLPGAWDGFLERNTTGNSCLGPLSGLEQKRGIYENALATLADGFRTTFVLVSRAQRTALREAERASGELAALGMRNQRLVLNGIFRSAHSDPVALALERREKRALEDAGCFLGRMRTGQVPLKPHNLAGVPALRHFLQRPNRGAQEIIASEAVPGGVEQSLDPVRIRGTETLAKLVDEIEKSGHGVIMTMGKGGVGKTTIAAAIATELARRGLKVHLSTTDPAAHIAEAAGQSAGMKVSRIDPKAETEAYAGQVMMAAGKSLDARGRALLEEDLRSPCTEEVAVFRAFARTVAQGSDSIVVLDTAPTGHTLLLLDASESFHHEIARKAGEIPEEVRELLPRLRDKSHTRVLIVTLPEATPVHEAAMLQTDLRRAKIEPFAWVINQSLSGIGSHDPVLVARGRGEARYIREVIETLSSRTVILPWVAMEPAGQEGLKQLFQTTC